MWLSGNGRAGVETQDADEPEGRQDRAHAQALGAGRESGERPVSNSPHQSPGGAVVLFWPRMGWAAVQELLGGVEGTVMDISTFELTPAKPLSGYKDPKV